MFIISNYFSKNDNSQFTQSQKFLLCGAFFCTANFDHCALALAGKFKKWVINSAPVLKLAYMM